jgi:hypothetical protein
VQKGHTIIEWDFSMSPRGTAAAQSTAAFHDQNLPALVLDRARKTKSGNAGSNNHDVNFSGLHI